MNQQTSPTSITITLQNVLASYLYCAQPKTNVDKQTGKETKAYECDAVFPATHPAFTLVRDTVRQVAKAAWGEDIVKAPNGQTDANGQAVLVDMPAWQAVLNELNLQGRVPMRDGNRRNKQEEPYTGNFYVKTRSSRQPRVVVTRGGVNVEIKPDDPQYPYSGATVNLVVDIWAQGIKGKPSPYGKRVNAQLTGVQFVAHGKKFGGGGRQASVDEFGLCPTDADAPPPGAVADQGANSLV